MISNLEAPRDTASGCIRQQLMDTDGAMDKIMILAGKGSPAPARSRRDKRSEAQRGPDRPKTCIETRPGLPAHGEAASELQDTRSPQARNTDQSTPLPGTGSGPRNRQGRAGARASQARLPSRHKIEETSVPRSTRAWSGRQSPCK